MLINKSFAVIRYESALLFDDPRARNNILKRLKNIFPVHDINDQTRMIIFVDPATKSKCVIQSDNIVVDIDEPRDLNALKSLVNEVAPFIFQQFEIQVSQYIGVRAHFIPEGFINQQKTEEEIMKRFYSSELISFLKNEVKQTNFSPRVGYTLQLDANLMMNVNFGSFQQVDGHIDNNGQLKITEVRGTNPLVDLDIFIQQPKEFSQINGVVKAACSNMEAYVDKVWNNYKRSSTT